MIRVVCWWGGHRWRRATWQETVPRYYHGAATEVFDFTMVGEVCARCGAKRLAHPERVNVS